MDAAAGYAAAGHGLRLFHHSRRVAMSESLRTYAVGWRTLGVERNWAYFDPDWFLPRDRASTRWERTKQYWAQKRAEDNKKPEAASREV